jgi:hypothetical protein
MESFEPKIRSGAPPSILQGVYRSKNILLWGINILLPVKRKKQGFPFVRF